VLLRYFGEDYQGECKNCDNCLTPKETWDGTLHAQKALSCIYRTGERFGATYLADVLVGAETEKILKFRHNQLSTFGIGKDLSQKEWISVLRQLTAQGHILPDMESFGSLKLTDSARSVLKGEATVLLNKESILQQSSKHRRAKSVTSARPVDSSPVGALFSKLKQKRMEIAKLQNVPPYVIFHDKTLIEIAERRPKTHSELRKISGLGDAKMSRYGDLILETVIEFAPRS